MLSTIVETKPLNLFLGEHVGQILILLTLMHSILQFND